jgi:hypothetical protein
MKQLEINGRQVLAVNVPEKDKYEVEMRVQDGSLQILSCLPVDGADPHGPLCGEWKVSELELSPFDSFTEILADSTNPESFAKVFYPDATTSKTEGAFVIDSKLRHSNFAIHDCESVAEAWQSVAAYILEKHGLSGRIILLTEKTQL